MPKPGDFYVGVIDFFSVLLPGVALAALLIEPARSLELLRPLFQTDAAVRWIAFALAAYTLGHFVFLVASSLDSLVYDRYRRRKWPRENDHCYERATELRREFFNSAPDAGDEPMNTFKWAKSLLMTRAPAALADVNRYEADSKFFRSVAVILPVLAVAFFRSGETLAAAGMLLLTWLSFVRYAERRHKSTEWAYQYVLVLHGLRDSKFAAAPAAEEG